MGCKGIILRLYYIIKILKLIIILFNIKNNSFMLKIKIQIKLDIFIKI